MSPESLCFCRTHLLNVVLSQTEGGGSERLGNLCPSLSVESLKAWIRYSSSFGLLPSSQAMISRFLFQPFRLFFKCIFLLLFPFVLWGFYFQISRLPRRSVGLWLIVLHWRFESNQLISCVTGMNEVSPSPPMLPSTSPFTTLSFYSQCLSFFPKPSPSLMCFSSSLFSPFPPLFNLFSHHSSTSSSFPVILPLGCRSSFRQPTTVSWRLWRCWGSWHSALWPEVWLIGLVSKLPSSSSSPSPLGRPCMYGRLPSLALSENTSLKNSPNEIRIRVKGPDTDAEIVLKYFEVDYQYADASKVPESHEI